MSNNDEFENLYMAYRAINNLQAKRTDLKLIGTLETGNMEDVPIRRSGNWEKHKL